MWISSCVPHTVAVMTEEMIPGTDDSFIVTTRRDGPKSAEKLVRKTYRLSSRADAQSQQMSTLKGETRSVNCVIVATRLPSFSPSVMLHRFPRACKHLSLSLLSPSPPHSPLSFSRRLSLSIFPSPLVFFPLPTINVAFKMPIDLFP